jgi:hypothetical protein
METREFNNRSIRSIPEALVLASGAVAAAFGFAAAVHMAYAGLRVAISLIG